MSAKRAMRNGPSGAGPVTVRTLSGSERQLPRAAFDTLGKECGQPLILPGDPGYDRARRVWNGMIDKRPAAIARCRDASAVRRCLHFARTHDLLLAVRGGAHNVAGFATCDGGLVIDLSEMRAISVEAAARTVRVEAGVTWGELDRDTQAFGLAVPGGVVSTTGVAGLTLGGGQGWLRRTYGLSCDSLLSADVITADGERLTASDTTNSDLFWALRGGGGNFGIVTEFEFRLHPVGPLVTFVAPVFPFEATEAALRVFREFVTAAPDAVNASAVLWTVPAAPAFPGHLQGRTVVTLSGIFVGDPERGEEVLQPLRKVGEPLFDMSSRLPYTELQRLFDPFFPAGDLLYYWKASQLDDLSDEMVADIVAATHARPSPLSMVSIWALGGAMSRVGPEETAVGRRDARFLVETLANWEASTDTDRNVSWVRDMYSAPRPLSAGRPNFNFPGLSETNDAFVQSVFGSQYRRLLAVKRQYDPTNLFRLNQNLA
jgi:FAD/FMN-containing dehydrogenase